MYGQLSSFCSVHFSHDVIPIRPVVLLDRTQPLEAEDQDKWVATHCLVHEPHVGCSNFLCLISAPPPNVPSSRFWALDYIGDRERDKESWPAQMCHQQIVSGEGTFSSAFPWKFVASGPSFRAGCMGGSPHLYPAQRRCPSRLRSDCVYTCTCGASL